MRLITWGYALAALAVAFVSATVQAADKSPFDKWEPRVQAIEKHDREHPPKEGGVFFVGSSTIQLWHLDQAFGRSDVSNRGISGSQIVDATHFADRLILPFKPRLIVFYAGDNDINAGKSADQVLADYKEFVAKIHAALPETRVLYLPVKPSPSRWKQYPTQQKANKSIEELSKHDKRLEYVDLVTPMLGSNGEPRPELYQPDKLHMSPEGYRIWNDVVRKYLDKPAK